MEGPDFPREADIGAYVDGELTPDQRLAVEAEAAADADLMNRLRADHALNAALRAELSPVRYSDDTLRSALALERRLKTRRWLPAAARIAAATACVALGWCLHVAIGPVFATSDVADARFADSAREALKMATLAGAGTGTGETIGRKIVRLEAVTDVDLPTLPANWRVKDAQVQSFNGRPSVVVTADSPLLGEVTLVAAPMEKESAVPPTPAEDETVPTVYWQNGGTAYALMGAATASRLKTVADGLDVANRRKALARTRG